MAEEKRHSMLERLFSYLEDIWFVYVQELRRIYHDKGVFTIFVVAVLAYPILYPLIYYNEVVTELPIAVIDDSHSQHSREYIRKLDATRDVRVAYECLNMAEAEALYHRRQIHGVVYLPKEFERALSSATEQAYVSVYCDMSSFLYYRNVLQASNFVMLDEHYEIQMRRYELLGKDHAMAEVLARPVQYETVMLYNPAAGYPSYLLPAILILILYQTLFLGICMLAGIAREQNGELYYIEGRRFERSTFRLVLGRAFAYVSLYIGMTVYVLGLVPRLFGFPHIGDLVDVMKLMVPFLLATSFFAMTISVFIRERETAMVTLLFSSIVLLFLSGASWPTSNLPEFWRYTAMLFPSTWGINGYIHINSCGATLAETSREYVALWIQAGVYFLTASLSYGLFGWYYEKSLAERRRVIIKLLKQRSAAILHKRDQSS